MTSLPLWAKRKICKSADAQKIFYVHLNDVVLNFTEFKNFLKFMNSAEF